MIGFIRHLIYNNRILRWILPIFYYRWNKRYKSQDGFLSGDTIKEYLDNDHIYTYHKSQSIYFNHPTRTITSEFVPKQMAFYAGKRFEISAGEVYHFDEAFLIGPNAVGVTTDGKIILDTAMDLPNVLHKCSPRLLMNYDKLDSELQEDWAASLVHLFCNSTYTNYFHWICDSVLLIEGVREYEKKVGRKIKLIVNDNLTQYQREYLEALDYSEEDLIFWKDYRKASIRNLVVVKSRRTGTNMDEIVSSHGMNWLSKSILSKINVPTQKQSERVFLTRQHESCRRITNFNTIEPILRKYNFQIVNTEGLSVLDQAMLFYNMKVLVAPHGAGLTNMIFSKKLAIIEMIGNVDNPKDFQWYCAYYSMSQALGHKYAYIIGETVPLLKPDKTKQIYDLKIDPVEFENLLIQVLDESQG